MQDVDFIANDSWYRDSLICSNCHSIPRERALMTVLQQYFPQWRTAIVHESSPGRRGASIRFAQDCPQYIASQYYPNGKPGSRINGYQCENLESLSFADNTIDLHITQDVLEHIFSPYKAFMEIARTLKPGGMHICTVPLVNKNNPSMRRAQLDRGKVKHLQSEQYHGNPVGDGRALVTIDWGFDICQHIFNASGLYTHIVYIDDLHHGIRAEYIEVLVSVKHIGGIDKNPL